MPCFKNIIIFCCLFIFSCGQKEKQNEQINPVVKALEVAIDINQRFQDLDSSLKHFTDSSKAKSEKILSEIERKVQERGKDSSAENALKKAKEMHTMSIQAIKQIEDLREKMLDTNRLSDNKETLDSTLTKQIEISKELLKSIQNDSI